MVIIHNRVHMYKKKECVVRLLGVEDVMAQPDVVVDSWLHDPEIGGRRGGLKKMSR